MINRDEYANTIYILILAFTETLKGKVFKLSEYTFWSRRAFSSDKVIM